MIRGTQTVFVLAIWIMAMGNDVWAQAPSAGKLAAELDPLLKEIFKMNTRAPDNRIDFMRHIWGCDYSPSLV